MTLWDITENLFFYVFVAIFSVSFIITVHEFGHYLAARYFGVAVEKFSVGFGKEICGFNDKAGTRWSVSWIPLGGYVKIFGDVDINKPFVWDHENNCERRLTKEELKLAYCTKTVWQRLAIVFAGPLANFLFTFLVLFLLYTTVGQSYTPPIINALGVDSESYKAGFQMGDQVLEMEGRKIRRWSDVYRTTMASPGAKFDYKVLRDGKEIRLTAKVQEMEYIDMKGRHRTHGRTGMVRFRMMKLERIRSVNGVDTSDNPELAKKLILQNLDKVITVGTRFQEDKDNVFLVKIPSEYNQHHFNKKEEDKDIYIYIVDADKKYYLRLTPFESFYEIYHIISKVIKESAILIKVSVQGKTDEPAVGGVPKISENFAKAAKSGWYQYIIIISIFSFMIGFINLLPIPILDGGHIVFLLYEAISGNPVSPRIQDIAFMIGLVLLGGIMIFANINDLVIMISKLE
tara:strand:- start:3653 stop:5029 length:1377 start_codon:yes stop_codon:yes gene_type:complete